MSVFTGSYITDQDIVRLSTDRLVRVWAYDEFPWLSILQPADASGDVKHYWLNNPEGLVKTSLADGMTGGSADEEISVADASSFAVGNVVLFQANGENDPQLARVTAVADAETMTVRALSGNLAAHASLTPLVLVGDYVKYGDTVEQPLRLPTRDHNFIEQVSVTADVPANVAKAQGLSEEAVEAMLTREAISEFKQKLTMATLFGDAVDPTQAGTEGYGRMDGLVNLIPDANRDDDGAWSKANFRDFVNALKKRGAFPGSKGILVANAEAVNQLYKLDDDNTGVSWRETDRPIDELVIRGVRFRVVEEPAMNSYFLPDVAAAFALSPKGKGRPLLRLARISTDAADGRPRRVLKEAVKYKLQVAQFAAIELRDPFRHGLFAGSAS
ncbi:MAG TPA: hypothetical protein ENN09_05165 [Planctomycetes bacterium]|nr:hypothetical protein [Planctomycetota bacterium]